MLQCQDFQKRFDLFLDGEVDGHTMRELALHVTRCLSCEAELRRSESLQERIAEAVESKVDRIDSEELWRSISTGLELPHPSAAARLRERWELRSGPSLASLALAASVALAALVAGSIWLRPSTHPVSRLANNHAQIDRLDSSASDVVVWSEPEEHTTAIWVSSYEP